LHCPLTTMYLPEFGDLPITCLASSISTLRPPDNVLIESTEFSGSEVFEEVVNLDDIANLRELLKEQLVELAQKYGETL
jgi:hypothetical protein